MRRLHTIGGYQVVKKWLSYREKPLLGRGLTPDEVRHVTDTCRRLAALIGMRGGAGQELRGSTRGLNEALQIGGRILRPPILPAWDCVMRRSEGRK